MEATEDFLMSSGSVLFVENENEKVGKSCTFNSFVKLQGNIVYRVLIVYSPYSLLNNGLKFCASRMVSLSEALLCAC